MTACTSVDQVLSSVIRNTLGRCADSLSEIMTTIVIILLSIWCLDMQKLEFWISTVKIANKKMLNG